MINIFSIAQNDLACYTKKRAPIFWTFIGPAACMWLFGFLTPSASRLSPVTVVNHDPTGTVASAMVAGLRRDGRIVMEVASVPATGLSVEVAARSQQPATIIIHAADVETLPERALRYEIQSHFSACPLAPVAERLPRSASTGGFQRTVPAYLIMFLTMNLLMSGANLAEERASGRLRRLLIAPVSNIEIVAGRLASRLVIAWLQMIVLLSVGVFVLHINWAQHPVSLVFALTLYALAMGGVGILIGTLFRDPDQAQTFAMWLALVTAPLAGLWWPVELMPAPVAALSQLLPTSWIMGCVNSMLSEGSSLSQFPLTVAGLAAVAAATIFLASRRLRWRK